jgi:hypothetical protein
MNNIIPQFSNVFYNMCERPVNAIRVILKPDNLDVLRIRLLNSLGVLPIAALISTIAIGIFGLSAKVFFPVTAIATIGLIKHIYPQPKYGSELNNVNLIRNALCVSYFISTQYHLSFEATFPITTFLSIAGITCLRWQPKEKLKSLPKLSDLRSEKKLYYIKLQSQNQKEAPEGLQELINTWNDFVSNAEETDKLVDTFSEAPYCIEALPGSRKIKKIEEIKMAYENLYIEIDKNPVIRSLQNCREPKNTLLKMFNGLDDNSPNEDVKFAEFKKSIDALHLLHVKLRRDCRDLKDNWDKI